MNAEGSFVSLSEISRMQPIDGWEVFWRDGEGYFKTAVGAHAKRQDVFTAEILYNLIAMAVEKFVMAALMSRGALPYNHTMRDLVQALEETFSESPEFKDLYAGLLALDKYQEICDIDTFAILPPEMDKIPAMLDLGQKLYQTLNDKLFQPKTDLTRIIHDLL